MNCFEEFHLEVALAESFEDPANPQTAERSSSPTLPVRGAMASQNTTAMQVSEEARDATAPAKRARTSKVQSIDQATQRAINDNFKSWPASAIDSTLVENLTLRQRIARDKLRQRASPPFPMGGPYYRHLKTIYAPAEDVGRQFKIAKPDEPISDALLKALQALRGGRPNHAPLLEFLRTGPSLNQKELVGLLRACLELRVKSVSQHHETALQILKYCVRSGFLLTRPDEMRLMNEHFNVILCQVLAAMRKERLSVESFWALMKKECHYVLNVVDADKVFAAAQWKDVKAEIKNLCSGTQLGMKMFGFALNHVASAEASELIEETVSLLEGMHLDIECVKEVRGNIRVELDKIATARICSERRAIQIRYRGLDIQVEVMGLEEEITRRLAAHIKSKAVEARALELFSCEEALIPLQTQDASQEDGVDADLVKEAVVARASADKILKESAWTSGENLLEILNEKMVLLLQVDETFKIELAMVEHMVRGGGEARLHQQVLYCLPAVGKPVNVASCALELVSVQKSVLHKFCNRATQGSVAVVIDAVRSLQRGLPPNMLTLAGTPFFDSVRLRFMHFFFATCRWAGKTGRQTRRCTARRPSVSSSRRSGKWTPKTGA